jgi:hypothetical protein
MIGTTLKQANEIRLFAHDAAAVTPGATQITGTTQRGVCLYVGGAGDLTVTMESGNSVTFTAVPAGTFLPILVTHVTAATATAILALY